MMIADSYDALARMIDYPSEKTGLQTDCDVVTAFMKHKGLDHHSLTPFADVRGGITARRAPGGVRRHLRLQSGDRPLSGTPSVWRQPEKGELHDHAETGVRAPRLHPHRDRTARSPLRGPRVPGLSGPARRRGDATAVHRRLRVAGSGTVEYRLCRPAGLALESTGRSCPNALRRRL